MSFESRESTVLKIIISMMHQLQAFKGALRQRGYGISGILNGLTRTFASVVKKGLLNLGKHAIKRGVQILDDVSRGEGM